MDASELLRQYAAGKRDFPAVSLNEQSLVEAELPEIVLRRASLKVTNLSNANLSQADLQEAILNVSRLSGANLSQANLRRCQLNVTNLIRALLVEADLSGASLVRAEMLRADLSNAQLVAANLREVDLREAKLRWANLQRANLQQADIRSSIMTGALLEEANLNAVNGDRADLSGVLLRQADLRHGNLQQVKLNGANLQEANLRWADLRGADLRNADLTAAKLSGTNLTGALLEGAILVDTVLVHADLSQANLMHATVSGADLSGATITGAKVFGTARYNLTTKEVACTWVDMSPNGDRTQIRKFADAADLHRFFNTASPQVHLHVDAPLTPAAHAQLAQAYYHLSQHAPNLDWIPDVTIANQQTRLTLTLSQDSQLWSMAYGLSLPFQATQGVQQALGQLLQMVQASTVNTPAARELQPMLKALGQALTNTMKLLPAIASNSSDSSDSPDSPEPTLAPLHLSDPFFQQPIQLYVTNSSNQRLAIYTHPRFGARQSIASEPLPPPPKPGPLPQPTAVLTFVRGFRAERDLPVSPASESSSHRDHP